MNGVPEYYRLKLAQTSKGIWYCADLEISGKTWDDIFADTDDYMTTLESLLEKHNTEAEK